MAGNNKNQKAVDRLLHPVVGSSIGVRDLMTDEGQRSFIDFGQFDYITKAALNGFNPPIPKKHYEYPFISSGGALINWQTDLIDGVNTFADILGNEIPSYAVVNFYTAPDIWVDGGVKPLKTVRPTTGPNAGLIQTVEWDWGSVETGVIVF